MPTIRIELFEGRTHDPKAALAAKITSASVETIGSSADAVDVIFHDIKKSDWASGGELWSRKGGGQVGGFLSRATPPFLELRRGRAGRSVEAHALRITLRALGVVAS